MPSFVAGESLRERRTAMLGSHDHFYRHCDTSLLPPFNIQQDRLRGGALNSAAFQVATSTSIPASFSSPLTLVLAALITGIGRRLFRHGRRWKPDSGVAEQLPEQAFVLPISPELF